MSPVLILMLAACLDAREAPSITQAAEDDDGAANVLEGVAQEKEKPKARKRAAPRVGYGRGAGQPGPPGAMLEAAPAAAAPEPMELDDADMESEEEAAEGAGPAERAWFPETFLFNPLVVTDADGRAEVPVKIPDRLTGWRVLGLAHTGTGAQAGATTRIQGTLPVYVDAVLPPFLRAGDRVRLPLQLVNTTDTARREQLSVTAEGGDLRVRGGDMALPAGSSQVAWAEVAVPRAGTLTLGARLGSADAVRKTVTVSPSGKPIEQVRGGTLAAERTMELIGADDLDPDSARVRLVVYPGALSVLRSELSSATSRTDPGGTAYALLLAGRGPALLTGLGEPVSADGSDSAARERATQLRDLRLIATQRAVRLARSPDFATSTLLVEAALTHPGDALLTRMGDRLLRNLQSKQLPDGTFGGSSSQRWTVQRLLVATADATRAAGAAAAVAGGDAALTRERQQIAARVQLRAGAAFERYQGQINDPYTAAAVLASGAVSGELAEALTQTVLKGIRPMDDGSKALRVDEDVVRADNLRPSRVEASALAALALQDNPEAKGAVADLGAYVLGAWRPGRGWGDGRTDLLCLQTVAALFSDGLPESVTVTLARDGQPVGSRSLSGDDLRELSILDLPAEGARGAHRWSVAADPPVPGLGFSLTLQTWVPWEARPRVNSLELAVQTPARPQVGQASPVRVTAAAPAGRPLRFTMGLPAGVQVDEDELQGLVNAGTLAGFEAEDGSVAFTVPALDPGQTFDAAFSVIPTLGGALASGPMSLGLAGADADAAVLAPTVWRISG